MQLQASSILNQKNWKMKKAMFILGLGLLFAILSCSTTKQGTGKTALNGNWELIRMGDQTIDTAFNKRGVPTLEFNIKENRVSGFAGCNRYFGSVAIDRSTLQFGALASTKMACAEPNMEDQYLKALSSEKIPYAIRQGQLFLGAGDEALVFQRVR